MVGASQAPRRVPEFRVCSANEVTMQDALTPPELTDMPEAVPSTMPVQEIPIWSPFRILVTIAQSLARLTALGWRASDSA
jgi:hypothetical protein